LFGATKGGRVLMMHHSCISCDSIIYGVLLRACGVDVEQFSPFANLNNFLGCVDAEEKSGLKLRVSSLFSFPLAGLLKNSFLLIGIHTTFGGCLNE
jgi:hypothetical protein